MTKADIVKKISDGTGLTQVEVSAVINGFMECVSEELEQDGRVELRGFGVFKVDKRAERYAINPQTLEKVLIPAKKVPVFRASDVFKSRIHPTNEP